jgi:hypothetical protein
MDWAYTNEVTIEKVVLSQNEGHVVNDLIELYLFGGVLKDVKLRNKTLRLLSMHVKASNLSVGPRQCHTVWENTAPDSLIRKLVVDHLVTLTSPEVFRKYSAEWPADLALQVALLLMDRYVKDEDVDMKALEERLENYMEAEADS